MKLLEIDFEGLPPTVNMIYRNSKNVRYKTKQTREFQERIIGLLKEAWNGRKVFEDRTALYITFITDDLRRWDIDNRMKALQDCLAPAGILKDDCQIDRLFIERLRENEKRTYLRVESIND